MSGSVSIDGSAVTIHLSRQGVATGPRAQPAETKSSQPPSNRVRVGSGQTTRDHFKSLPATGGLAKWKAYLACPVAVLVAAPFLAVGLLAAALIAAAKGSGACSRLAERERKADKDTANRIGDNIGLMKLSASSLGADHSVILDKLVKHSEQNGSNFTREQLNDLVQVGEGVVNYLVNGNEGFGRIPNRDPDHVDNARDDYIKDPAAKPYLAKAVAWYMMAKAAQKDVVNERANAAVSDGDKVDYLPNVTRENVMQMPDPEGRIYGFLKSVPTAAPRMSTHWLKQSATALLHTVFGFIPVSRPEQWGIDSFAHGFPGEGGAMLFDQLEPVRPGKPPRLAVKFEGCGCPSFSLPKDVAPGTTRFEWFAAASYTNAGHSFSFLATRGNQGSKNQAEVGRTEHTGKKVFKEEMGETLKEIDRLAQRTSFKYKAGTGSGGSAVGRRTLQEWREYLPALRDFVALRSKDNIDSSGLYQTTLNDPDTQLLAEAYENLPGLCDSAITQLENFAERVEGASGTIDGLSPMGAEVLIDIVPRRGQ